MEESSNLKDLLEVVKKRSLMIILITVLAASISGGVSYFLLTPMYQTSTQILVNQQSDSEIQFDYNQIRTDVELINTYSVIIKSPTILDDVVKQLDLDISTSTLNGMINVNNEQDSQVVSLTVTDSDPDRAVAIANTTAKVFEKKIKSIMNVDNVSILSIASFEGTPSQVSPQPLLNIAIALVLGLMTGVGIALLLNYFDNTLKTEDDITKILELPVLGTVGIINDREKDLIQVNSTRKPVRGDTVES